MTHHRPARSRPLAAALACLTVAVLAACHDSDADPPPETSSPTAPPSQAGPTEANAAAFGQRSFQAWEKMFFTGESAAFRSLTLDSCTGCQTSIANAATLREAIAGGGSITGGPIVVRSTDVRLGTLEGRTTATYTVDTFTPPLTVTGTKGDVNEHAAVRDSMVFELVWADHAWAIQELGR